MTGCRKRGGIPSVALGRADVTDAAVAMIEVVPMHEAGGPGAGLVGIGKALGGKPGAVLGRAEQRLGIGVVAGDARPGVRGFIRDTPEYEGLSVYPRGTFVGFDLLPGRLSIN